MASKELQKLKRRELLKMLLVQCQETERLQRELDELTNSHTAIMESYERLKHKLNVKDERLNQKDMKIRELQDNLEEMKASRIIELEEAGSIAEAAMRINGVFEAAQKAAEQYLLNVKKLAEKSPKPAEVPIEESPKTAEEKRIPFEAGWRAGIRRKATVQHIRRMAAVTAARANAEAAENGAEHRAYAAAAGDMHG